MYTCTLWAQSKKEIFFFVQIYSTYNLTEKKISTTKKPKIDMS